MNSDDKPQEVIVAGNVTVGGDEANMEEGMIEQVQEQSQMVEQCGDVMAVEAAGTLPSHVGMLQRHLPVSVVV